MLGQTLYTLRKRNPSKLKFWEFWLLRLKFIKLSFLKEQVLEIWITFSVSWDITPLHFFSWSFIYFQQKEPIKVQIWWNFMWAVTSQKFCTLMGLFCPNNIKLWLKKYRRVIHHDIGEWCRVHRKTVFWFQLWHEEFYNFLPTSQKTENFTVMGSFCPKYVRFELKKWRGVIFPDTEQWCKIWTNPDFVVSNIAEELGELSLEHLEVWKIVLW